MQGQHDQAALGLRLLCKSSAKPPIGRANSSPQVQEALKLDPLAPVKAATRAVPGSPLQDPDRAAPALGLLS